MRVGRERWFTDIIRWFYDEKVQKYYVLYGGSKQPQVDVQPLRVVTRGDGLQGIIVTPDYLKGPGISAVLSLPDRFSPKIKVISFYFPDSVSLDDVALVLNSVSIIHRRVLRISDAKERSGGCWRAFARQQPPHLYPTAAKPKEPIEGLFRQILI